MHRKFQKVPCPECGSTTPEETGTIDLGGEVVATDNNGIMRPGYGYHGAETVKRSYRVKWRCDNCGHQYASTDYRYVTEPL